MEMVQVILLKRALAFFL